MTKPASFGSSVISRDGQVRPRMVPLSCPSTLPSKGYFLFAFLLSLGVHAGLYSALTFSWNFAQKQEPLPPPPPEATIEMSFESPEHMPKTQMAKGQTKTPKPTPFSEAEKEGPQLDTKPRKAPIEEPPPPPPPPQAVPKPSGTPAHDLEKVPLPAKMEAPALKALKSATTPSPEQERPKVVPPTPSPKDTEELPKKIIPSHLTQPHEAKKNEPDTHSLMATLDKFRVDQKQTHPPKARPNPQSGGSRSGGGTPEGENITKELTLGEQQKIGLSVRRCYSENTAAKNYASFVAHLVVTIDERGIVREVNFAPQTQKRAKADPTYQVMAEAARSAVLDPKCATLPLSEKYLGQMRQLNFEFRP